MTQALEKDISSAIVRHLNELRQVGALSFYVNIEGGRRDARQQVALKRQGARPGRPDIELLLPGGKTIFVELKRKKGGRLSPHQQQEIANLEGLGFETRVLRVADEADGIDQVIGLLVENGVVK